jgi:glutaminyl-peptide cyclotransferase
MGASAAAKSLDKGVSLRVGPRRFRKSAALAVALLGVLGSLSAWRSATTSTARSAFDGERAFEDLRHVVKFGPRPPGSAAIREARQYISAELSADGIEVWCDNFTASTPAGVIPMTNIVGVIMGRSPSVVMIASHYDTARMDRIRFVGANDGGSSTALLLEVARVLKRRNNKLTYWVVFFDGEEALKQWSASDSLYGSRHMAEQLEADGRLRQIRALLLVGMIADRHLDVLRESNSTPWLSDLVFKSARQLGYGRLFYGGRFPVEDDHLPFLARGIPAVDIIDLTPFGNVDIAKDDRHLFFSVGGRLLISRQLTGQFPNYQAVLPRENDKVVELDGERVAAAIRRVALLADEHSHALRLQLEPGRLEISSSNSDYGEAHEVVDITYAGTPLRVGFNYQYLLDFLGAIGKSGAVRMELKDEQSAVQFCPVDQDTGGYKYIYILMPVRD